MRSGVSLTELFFIYFTLQNENKTFVLQGKSVVLIEIQEKM